MPALDDLQKDGGSAAGWEEFDVNPEHVKKTKASKIKQSTDTLIISDLHLGSEVCRAKELVRTLKEWDYRRLVLLGDIFDDLNFKRLRKSHWKFLSYMRKISKKVDVVWVKGNHDKHFYEMITALMGVAAHEEFTFDMGSKRMLAIHGDQFDRFMTENPRLSLIAGRAYIFIQRLDGRGQRISRYIKRKSKGWLKVSSKIASTAIDYAERRGAEVIFCGHTHKSMIFERDGITYYNTGCWTDSPSTFVTISAEGRIDVHEVA